VTLLGALVGAVVFGPVGALRAHGWILRLARPLPVSGMERIEAGATANQGENPRSGSASANPQPSRMDRRQQQALRRRGSRHRPRGRLSWREQPTGPNA